MPNWSINAPCPQCRLPRPLCVCSLLPRIATSTQVVMLIHHKEFRRSSNTGRFVPLAIQGATVCLQGLRDQPVTTEALTAGGSPVVLFPGRRARPLTPELAAALPRPLTLIVPDGNWNQASHMMRRLPLLAEAPAIELPAGPEPGLRRMRRNVFSDRMSTFEAVAQTLGLLEGPEVEEQLLEFFRRTVDRLLMLRGKLKAADVYGGLPEPAESSEGGEPCRLLS